MLSDISRCKRPLKIIISVEPNDTCDAAVCTSKVAPIISQTGVYEANLVDLFIEKFLEKSGIDYSAEGATLRAVRLPLVINIYRQKHTTNFIILNPTIPEMLRGIAVRRYYLRGSPSSASTRLRRYIGSRELFQVALVNYTFFENGSPL